MALESYVGTFDVLTTDSTGVKTITFPVGKQFTPKLILFLPNYAGFDGEITNHTLAFGASTGASDNYCAFSTRNQDSVGTSNAARTWSDSHCLLMSENDSNTIEVSGAVTALNATGFSINIDNIPVDRDKRIAFLALGGSDLNNVEVGSFPLDITKTVGQTQTVTMAGSFTPNALIIASGLYTAASENWDDDLKISIGITDFTREYCIGLAVEDNQGTTVSREFSRDDTVVMSMDANTGPPEIDGRMSIGSAGAGTFGLNVDDQMPWAENCVYIAIDCPYARVDFYDSKETTGLITTEQTVCGFTPDALFLMSDGGTDFNASADNLFSMGVISAPGEGRCIAGTDDNNEATSNVWSYLSLEGEFVVMAKDGDPNGRQELSAFKDTGFVMNQITANDNSDQVMYMALGADIASPSESPSDSPSLSPSASESPSDSPSLSPSASESPSDSPSMSPSDSPSMSPSDSPSMSPSNSPSMSPSNSPSMSPSNSPSNSPSMSPSNSPSDSPSMSPSDSPSMSPSDSPSMSPSDSPSMSPSDSPSISPSDSPSMSPSDSPSISPSNSPSDSPSMSPSNSPSDSPSMSPSNSPSLSPSASESPSESPSDSPSESPSPSPGENLGTLYLDNIEFDRPQSDIGGTPTINIVNCLFESDAVDDLPEQFLAEDYYKEDFIYSNFNFTLPGKGDSFWLSNDYETGVGGLARGGIGAFYFYSTSIERFSPDPIAVVPCHEEDVRHVEYWSYLTTFWNYLRAFDRSLFENFWLGMKLVGDSLHKKASRFYEALAPENSRTCVLDDFYDLQVGPLYSVPTNLDPTVKDPNYIIRPLNKVLLESFVVDRNNPIYRDMIEITSSDYYKIRNIGIGSYVVVQSSRETVSDRYFKVYNLLSSEEPKARMGYAEITDGLNDLGADSTIGILALESLGDDIAEYTVVINDNGATPTAVTWDTGTLVIDLETTVSADPIGEVMDTANWTETVPAWAKFINKSGYDTSAAARKTGLPLFATPVEIDDMPNYIHAEEANGRYYESDGKIWKWFENYSLSNGLVGDHTKGEYVDSPSKYKYMIVVEGDLSYLGDDTFNIYLTTGRSYSVDNYITSIPTLQKDATPGVTAAFHIDIDYSFDNYIIEFNRDIIEQEEIIPGDFLYCHKTPIFEHYLFELYGDMVNDKDWNEFNYDNESGKAAINSLLLSLQNSSTREDYERALNVYYGLPIIPDNGKVEGLYETYGYDVTAIAGDVITLKIVETESLHNFIQPGVKLLVEGKGDFVVSTVIDRAAGTIRVSDIADMVVGDKCHVKLVNRFSIQSVYEEGYGGSSDPGYIDVYAEQNEGAIQHMVDVIETLSNETQLPEMIVFGTKNLEHNFDGIYHIAECRVLAGASSNVLRLSVYKKPDNGDALYNDFIGETKVDMNAGFVHIPWPTHKFLYLLLDGEYYHKAYLDAPIDTIYAEDDDVEKYSIVARNASILTKSMFPDWYQFDHFRNIHGLEYQSNNLELTKTMPGIKFGEFFPNRYKGLI